MPLLFSYGTLQDGDVQVATFGRRPNGEKDLLPGYEPSLVRIADPAVAARLKKTHHDNVSATGDDWSTVQGTALEVTDDELLKADAYEGEFGYRRREVTLSSGRQGWVYVHGVT
jgi:gamma-glutamylcyclotransferase (GGCT)/AIG2-like uncharacterized protein YtfP